MSKNGIPEMTGIMVCGHGSRNQNAAREFATVAEGLKARYPDVPVEYGYLEFCNPVISDGLDRLREQGLSPAFWRCRACCLPQATPRTTFPRCSTPIRHKIPAR
jgi:sirohydrochlorin ferrochelatase